MSRPYTLYQFFSDNNNGKCSNLNNAQIESLVDLLGKGCMQKTKNRIRSLLRYPRGTTNYGIFNRVLIKPDIRYIAGQSYPDEIRTVRECLVKG